MAEFASKGVAGTALGLSIGSLGAQVLAGGVGNLLNGLRTPQPTEVNCGKCGNSDATLMAAASMMSSAMASAASRSDCCSEDHNVNRYEAAQQARIAELETEVKLRDANIYTDQKSLQLYQYIDGELKDIRNTLCAQAVHNQRTEDSFTLARQDLAAVRSELCSAIALEAERRCCADNSIVNYANATFYPKLVADVTAGTTTTAQTLYNPIPKCGCCNSPG